MDVAPLLNRINALSPDSQRLWGRMSVGQMLTHCTDQVRIVLSEKPARPFGVAPFRWLAKWMFLKVPMRMPKNLMTAPELDPNGPLMTQPSDFKSDHANLIAALHRLNNVPESQPIAHPVFGTMTKVEAMKLTQIHLDHHLRQFGV